MNTSCPVVASLLHATSFRFAALVVALCLWLTAAQVTHGAPQQANASADNLARGVELYEQGNDVEAIKALRAAVKERKEDFRAWHYLGLASQRQGKQGDARKAHEKAGTLADKSISIQLSAFQADYRAVALQLKKEISEAADSSEKYLALSPKLSKSKFDEWQERVEYLRDLLTFTERDEAANGDHKILTAGQVTTKARILSKPEAEYTAEARQHQITGTVVLRAMLATDGKVRGIYPISGLPDGLTRNAIKAARGIKFTPATIEGQPVRQFIQIEYSFNLY